MFIRVLILLAAIFASVLPAQAASFPDPPAHKVFILDQADMISPSDEIHIQSNINALMNEHRIPIFVVTIESLASYGAHALSIEQYARLMFDRWGIGSHARNYGMLLLISKTDRKARIELGHDWAGTRNTEAEYVMDEIMIPHFKEKYFSDGIREAVVGMDAMARGLDLPDPYMPTWYLPLMVSLAFICLCVGLSFLKDGKKGFGWLFITICIAILIALLKAIVETIESSDGLDGGFGGGGGATGGW